jgi:hypothetical protein
MRECLACEKQFEVRTLNDHVVATDEGAPMLELLTPEQRKLEYCSDACQVNFEGYLERGAGQGQGLIDSMHSGSSGANASNSSAARAEFNLASLGDLLRSSSPKHKP